ncbi:uncharacterized protein LOC129194064 [Dunckerocampus dactyliophorus]|uniref:uncharacterized protein LOC129194064 n=1 Tax=Dunckerocampus dactyliophorus TaxID=161453 RepID=UPI002406EDBC|nr:uncharacterized protein LOC129194064 [Dunckerocampus dactyliophorus]
MGCRLTRNKARQPSRHRHRDEQRFVDQYGQPISMQVEGRRGRGHRRRRVEHSRTPSERHWEALRAMGLMEPEEGRAGGYNDGHFYDNMASNVYAANTVMMSPDTYPTSQHHHGSNYLPSVSYSLDHLDRLDCQAPEMSAYQPNSESCLLGCYNSEQMEHKNFSKQSDYRPPWRPLGYLPLSELDSGLGCGPDSPHQRVALSEAETDAMSSLPGHTPSSQGSSSSSESLISSEPSDSGFHSVSTGEHRCFHKIHRHAHQLRSGHSPREQRGRWDLESIPETTPMSHVGGAPQSSHCTVGNSTTTTVHFHRAERSPTLPRNRSPPSPSAGCRTEPCQRRALWLEQRQGRGGGTIEAPGRSRTVTDLTEAQQRRRASHPVDMETDTVRKQVHSSQPRPSSNTLGPRSRASYPTNCPPSAHLNIDRTSLTGHQNTTRTCQSMGRRREEDLRRHGMLPSTPTDWRGFQTLGNRTSIQKDSAGPYYSTLGVHMSPRSPPSPRSRQSNQKSVRNQLLRARAYRLARERSEVTTDEEMRGDMERPGDNEGEDGPWAGRYWNRTERRRHLALSRQHRERRGGEDAASGGQGSLSSQMVLELSHRKQNRLRNSKLLDDWTTVEELLTHGTRVEADTQLCPSPLLSVTTV